MGLGNALQIGRSALLASQAALEVTGNNLANAANRSYHRQRIDLASSRDHMLQRGIFVGTGVQIQDISRQVDEALEARLRGGIADEAGSAARQEVLRQVEAIENELSEIDLSTRLGAFFNAWSELANSPEDFSLRTLVLSEGDRLADHLNTLHRELTNLRSQTDRQIDQAAVATNDLLDRIAELNQQIVTTEGTSGSSHGLRDQRDALLSELSEYLDVSTVEQPNGTVDIFIDSIPVVLNGQNRGLEIRRQVIDGESRIDLVLSADGSVLTPDRGRLGALLASRGQDVDGAIDTINRFAHELAWQVNRVHSQGQGTEGYAQVRSAARVADSAAALNSEAAALDFVPGHGSFELHLTQKSTGVRTASTIRVDLDGLGGNDTSLDDLAAAIGAVDHVSAAVTADGRLTISADGADFELSFANDTSGTLAALGINTYFTGGDASDLAVNPLMDQRPALLAAGQGHVNGDNRNALALAGLRNQGLDALGGQSLSELWNRHVEDFAIRLGQTEQELEAKTIVRESLEAQRQSVSGVNMDEEVINLLQHQRAFQAGARLISVVDELMQTLLSMA
jgi:flagellar hook-associated protein 1 FlgK